MPPRAWVNNQEMDILDYRFHAPTAQEKRVVHERNAHVVTQSQTTDMRIQPVQKFGLAR